MRSSVEPDCKSNFLLCFIWWVGLVWLGWFLGFFGWVFLFVFCFDFFLLLLLVLVLVLVFHFTRSRIYSIQNCDNKRFSSIKLCGRKRSIRVGEKNPCFLIFLGTSLSNPFFAKISWRKLQEISVPKSLLSLCENLHTRNESSGINALGTEFCRVHQIKSVQVLFSERLNTCKLGFKNPEILEHC